MTESPLLEKHFRIVFFQELMQTANHYPALKMRLREHFNRFELEDLAKLFAVVALEAVEDDTKPELEEGSDDNETTPEDTLSTGEDVSIPVSQQTEESREEFITGESGSDSPSSA